MAPKRRPNPIGQQYDTPLMANAKRSVDTKVIQGEVDAQLHAACKRAVDRQGFTMREMVEWGAREFLRRYGDSPDAPGA